MLSADHIDPLYNSESGIAANLHELVNLIDGSFDQMQ